MGEVVGACLAQSVRALGLKIPAVINSDSQAADPCGVGVRAEKYNNRRTVTLRVLPAPVSAR